MRDYKVYRVVERKATTGERFLTTRWVMARRDGGVVRARFVCREFRSAGGKRTDLFAPATSVLTSRVIDAMANHRRVLRFTFDAGNAFFHADEVEECYCEPPDEWRTWMRKRSS